MTFPSDSFKVLVVIYAACLMSNLFGIKLNLGKC